MSDHTCSLLFYKSNEDFLLMWDDSSHEFKLEIISSFHFIM